MAPTLRSSPPRSSTRPTLTRDLPDRLVAHPQRRCARNQSKVTQLLVDANADPTLAMASSGTTPAAIAQKNGHAEVMEVIQKAAPASAPPAEEPEEQVEDFEVFLAEQLLIHPVTPPDDLLRRVWPN